MGGVAFRLLLTGLIVGSMMKPAFAYLDPGTGSIVLQAILGSVAAGAIIARTYWSRAKSWLGFGKETARNKSDRRK